MCAHRTSLLAAAALCGGLTATAAHAAEYYVATTGSDANPGTMAQPFASLQKGHDVAAAGDTVWIRGGTYRVVNGATSTAGFNITKSGQSDARRIRFWAYPGELPVFDFSQLRITSSTNNSGFYVTGSWLHFKGFEVANVPMGTRSSNGIWNRGGSNNTFELLNIHHITGPGLSIANGNGGHLVLNCDSHDNYDPSSDQGDGQNADGFGVHYQETGPSTILRGCRAWWNSDDGYDLISQEVPVIIEDCWAAANGYANAGTTRPGSGNGNGFKAGSSKTGIRHVLRNNLAWKNRASGFYANHSSGGNDWFNNTSYMNGTQYDLLASTWDADGNRTDGVILTGARAHRMRNNIGFPNKNSNMGGVDTMFDSWDLGIVPASGDFVSVSDAGYQGPRQADGSLPALDFMKLRAGSPLIDKGTDVGLPYAGAAPDLGAYEFSASTGGTGGGAGGRGGAGGASGNGGAGSGGGAGTGAAAGAGGRGGSTGRGGAGATAGSAGGASGTSGAAGSGPGAGAGGTSGASGSAGAAGDSGAGGSATGGTTGTGGDVGSGGASGAAGGSGGGGAAAGGSSAGTGGDDPAPAGCACGVAPVPSGSALIFWLALLALVVKRKGGPR